jgi:hypothetical protein
MFIAGLAALSVCYVVTLGCSYSGHHGVQHLEKDQGHGYVPFVPGMNEGLSSRLGYTLVENVPRSRLPGFNKGRLDRGGGNNKRVIVVGDVHGMLDECKFSRPYRLG